MGTGGLESNSVTVSIKDQTGRPLGAACLHQKPRIGMVLATNMATPLAMSAFGPSRQLVRCNDMSGVEVIAEVAGSRSNRRE
jgi:hypothetical protein